MQAPATKPPVSAETLNTARDKVRALLESSEAYAQSVVTEKIVWKRRAKTPTIASTIA